MSTQNNELPSWLTSLRPHQPLAIQSIVNDLQSGTDIVFLEAPTGSGKTLIAELVRQELGARTAYLCSSISLQHQFLRDYPYSALLMGRSNYPTLDYPSRYNPSDTAFSLSCADCTKRKITDGWVCDWCSTVRNCPYESAKITALRSNLVCANTYYFLYETNFVGSLSGRDLVVIDEADTLERTLMSFIQVEITQRRVEEFQLPVPDKKTVASSWLEWAQQTKEHVDALVKSHAYFQGNLYSDQPDLKLIKKSKRLESLQSDIKRLLDPDYGLESGNWVYDGYRENHIIFKPITVHPYAQQYLWKHARQFLLMSATIISVDEMRESLGCL